MLDKKMKTKMLLTVIYYFLQNNKDFRDAEGDTKEIKDKKDMLIEMFDSELFEEYVSYEDFEEAVDDIDNFNSTKFIEKTMNECKQIVNKIYDMK